jgi:hypothetical protein
VLLPLVPVLLPASPLHPRRVLVCAVFLHYQGPVTHLYAYEKTSSVIRSVSGELLATVSPSLVTSCANWVMNIHNNYTAGILPKLHPCSPKHSRWYHHPPNKCNPFPNRRLTPNCRLPPTLQTIDEEGLQLVRRIIYIYRPGDYFGCEVWLLC